MPALSPHSRSHVSTSPRVGLRQGTLKRSRYRDDECNRNYPHSTALMNATILGSSPTENEPSDGPRLPPESSRSHAPQSENHPTRETCRNKLCSEPSHIGRTCRFSSIQRPTSPVRSGLRNYSCPLLLRCNCL